MIGLLRFPGDDAALDVDLPRARAGAIHPVGRAHDLVVLPALAVAILPAPVLVGDDAVAVGEIVDDAVEECQAIEKVAHRLSPFIRSVTQQLSTTICPARRRTAARRVGCRSPK